MFYIFEQFSLHSFKRKIYKCFKASFFWTSCTTILKLISWYQFWWYSRIDLFNSPFSSKHTWSDLPISWQLGAMLQRQTVLHSFASGNGLVPKSQTHPWIHVKSTNRGNLFYFFPPLVFWKHSSPLPVSALCNRNPDFLDQANTTIFMLFLSSKVRFEKFWHLCIKYTSPDVNDRKLRAVGPSFAYYMDEKEEKKAYRGFI